MCTYTYLPSYKNPVWLLSPYNVTHLQTEHLVLNKQLEVQGKTVSSALSIV